MKSRPVLTEVSFELSRSIIGRLYSVLHLRTIKDPMTTELTMYKHAYLRDDAEEIISFFQSHRITYNPAETIKWINCHPNAHAKVAELQRLFNNYLQIEPISNIKIHLKLESLLKEEPIQSWR